MDGGFAGRSWSLILVRKFATDVLRSVVKLSLTLLELSVVDGACGWGAVPGGDVVELLAFLYLSLNRCISR